MNIEADIRAYVAANLLFSDEGFTYPDEASFLREGIIDSLGVMELVTCVTTHFGINVVPEEVTPENFDSVRNLAAYVRRKQQPSTPPRSSQLVPA
jgi:acyl carrier protein